MEITQIFTWQHARDVYDILTCIIIVDQVIKTAAEKRGWKSIVSVCDYLANFFDFFFDVITGLINAFLTRKRGGSNGKDDSSSNDIKPTDPSSGIGTG